MNTQKAIWNFPSIKPCENDDIWVILIDDRDNMSLGMYTNRYSAKRLEGVIIGTVFYPWTNIIAWTPQIVPEKWNVNGLNYGTE